MSYRDDEHIVCEFLREISPSREWRYLAEVEHYWIGELCESIREHERAENAKLRELVSFIMHQCNDGNPRCDECIGWNDGECMALLRMRELGIEVDG